MRALIRNPAMPGGVFRIAFVFAFVIGHAPAANAQVRTDDHTAVVTTAGVEVEIDTEAWRGEPGRFNKVLPVLVRITNDGEVPLRIRHTDFALVTQSGERVVATPPFELKATETVAVDAPVSPFYGFRSFGQRFYRYSPRFFPLGYVGRAVPFGYPFSPFGELRQLQPVQLPTSDMVSQALPESVVEPGARVTGFIYFVDDDDHVDLDHAGPVDFRAELVSAETRAPIGTIEIPLLAKSDRLEVPDLGEN